MNTKNFKKIQKTAAIMMVSVLTVFSGPGLVSADFSAMNDHTGFNSSNDIEATGMSSLLLSNVNTELVANVAVGSGETGDNEANENTGDGSAVSGELDVEGSFENELNLNVSQTSDFWSEGDFTAENNTTGADSSNEAEATFESLLEAVNTNSISVGNTAEIDASTGGNEANENTGEGMVETGEIGAVIEEMNSGNVNSLEVSGDMGNTSFDAMAMNEKTGADSSNDAEARVMTDVAVVNSNFAEISNAVTFMAETGDNEANENTGDGIVETGDAEAEIVIGNDTNGNIVSLDFELSDATLESHNMMTGSGSSNEAEATLENTATVVNTNVAGISNSADVSLSTGGNEANQNSGSSGSVDTGDATANVSIDNGSVVNGNVTEINLGLDDLTLSAMNENTGADSSNDAEARIENDATIVNTNVASLANQVTVDSETGDNEANENTGDGDVMTGDSDVAVDITNQLNLNETVLDYSPGSLTLEASSSHTGADSSNEAEATIENTVAIANVNTAEVVNDISVTSNTGGNESNQNTGSGSADTGAVNMTFSVTNTANQNHVEQ